MIGEWEELINLGLAVHLLEPRSKAPKVKDWSNLPRATYSQLRKSYRKGQNVGVRLGKHSRIEDEFAHVIDLDIRDDEYADEAHEALRELFPGVNFDRLPTVQSGSGGTSRHYYFLTQDPFRSKKLAHSEDKFEDEDGHTHWCWEIELFGTGKQVAAPPSIHPSGGRYKWLREFDIEMVEMGILPHIDAEVLSDLVHVEEDYEHDNHEPLGLSLEEAEDGLNEVQEWADDRDLWVRVGMALKHEFGEDGWDLFDRWSRNGRGYNRRENRKQWNDFGKRKRDKIYTMRSVMQEANHRVEEQSIVAAIDDMDDLVGDAPDDEQVTDKKPSPGVADEFEDLDPQFDLPGVPNHVLRVPGKLQGIVNLFNQTANRPQPQFATQVALAVGSVILARHYQTGVWGNRTSTYFVNLGSSSAGKEHTQKIITRVLRESGAGGLIGFAEYASGPGVTSALKQKPRHITLTDEFHEYLQLAKNSSDTNKPDAQKQLLSVWSKIDGIYLGPAYSTRGQNKQQADQTLDRTVEAPSPTMMGMGITRLFYSALSKLEVDNGFLSRLVVANSVMGIPKPQKPRDIVIPESVKGWISRHIWPDTDGPNTGIINQGHPELVPSPIIIPLSAEAEAYGEAIQQEIDDRMRKLEDEGLETLFGRTFEQIMRIALIVTMSEESGTVETRHIKWAYRYVMFYHEQMLHEARTRLGKTETLMIAEDVAHFIESQGEKGVARNRLANRKKVYGTLSKRETEEVEYLMERNFNILYTTVKGYGPKVRKFVHAKFLKPE